MADGDAKREAPTLKWPLGDLHCMDWSKCQALDSDQERQAGAWCFKGTRLPAHIVLEFLSRGYTVDDAIETYDVNPDQLKEVLRFVAESLEQEKPVHANTVR